MIYYSASSGGFYHSSIHAIMPDDVREISAETHRALLAAQANGLSITGNSSGDPQAVDPISLLTLAELKERSWQSVKRLRDAHADGGCTVPGLGRFDTDALSRSNINGAVTGAMLANASGQEFSVAWKLANNSIIELSANQMLTVGTTVLAHISACHAYSQSLAPLIEAAQSKADLDGIDIETGWPS